MRPRRVVATVICVALCGLAVAAPSAGAAGKLRAGAGRADVTPPTGYFLMGWVRSDAAAEGQLTRLFARSVVLQQGKRKVALVAVDLGFVPAGLVYDVADRLRRRGFSKENIVISASHTHSAPAGYSNYPGFNTVAPTSTTPTEFELAPPADEQLYTFLVRRIAEAIRRADDDRARAKAGWGKTQLLGVTENRSLEAHLADHDVIHDPGEGSIDEDPGGYPHTIDPDVNVLRIDKAPRRGRRVPIAIWSTFANHGTVVKPTFPYYNADHHAAAARIAEEKIRKRGGVPRRQEVINAYGNADQGDMTAGLEFSGPAGAHEVGRAEALAMVKAWRRAGDKLRSRAKLNIRWTVECFCGRDTAAGPVDERAVVGLPFLTGSEENRGPLYDETGVPFEGERLPVGVGPQGVKIQAVPDNGSTFPDAVPLTTLRVGKRAIVTVPGEMTAGMGRKLRSAAEAAIEGSGIGGVVISGLANDYVQYFTSPKEYDRQHYEGGATLFGRASAIFIQERLIELLERMVGGEPAPAPDPYDARNGVEDSGAAFGSGAGSAQPLGQPERSRRLDRASFRWHGGPDGTDRPLDRPFIKVKRKRKGGGGKKRWRRVDDDLGLRILWTVDENGDYEALWEPAERARAGKHRFVVIANRYRLRSQSFKLRPSNELEPKVLSSGSGRAVIELRYPEPVENRDLTWRPERAAGPRLAGKKLNRRLDPETKGKRLVIEGNGEVEIPAGKLRDRFGNRTREALSVEL